MNSTSRITIIGAGLAGCLLAIYLARRGFQVEIYERRSDIRATPYKGGRSINLTLAARGIHALQQVGLDLKALKNAVPLKGRSLHSANSEQTFQPYGLNDADILYALCREDLSVLLLKEMEAYEQIRVFFNLECTRIDFCQKILQLQHTETKQQYDVQFNTVIGADGSDSAIRKVMVSQSHIEVQEEYLEHSYREITIPAHHEYCSILPSGMLHVWSRRQHLVNGFPNLNGSMTFIWFAPLWQKSGLSNLMSEASISNLFKQQFSDIYTCLPDIGSRYFSSRLGKLVTIKCNSWSVEDKGLLIGDAAHAIVPFHGQGMNCAFEDCAVLDDCIATYGEDWARVFQAFQALRQPNADAISALSLENYKDLQAHDTDPKFHLKKQIERTLACKYPEHFIPRFSMVCFHRIPYVVAKQRGVIQQQIIESLSESAAGVAEVDWNRADHLIKHQLTKLCLI
jgi:kynurenine 3-monooxygenase